MHEVDKSAAVIRFRQLIHEDDDISISLFVLRLIRELKTTSPKPRDEIAAIADSPDRTLCLRTLDWLEKEHMVTIAGDNVQLTAAADQSISQAARSHQQLPGFLTGSAPEPGRAGADRMLLAILRVHFDHPSRP